MTAETSDVPSRQGRRTRNRRQAPYDRSVPRKTSEKTAGQNGSGPKSNPTRERILDAAAHVLSRKGYSGTRLGDIADQARLQAPAIYYYWPSREELIEEVMWVGIQRLHRHVAEVLDALPDGTPPMDQIAAAVEAHLHIALDLSDFATAVIRNSGQVPEEMRVRQLAEDAKYGSLWRGLIQAAQSTGDLRPDLDPKIAQRLVIGALNWAAEWWNPSRDSLGTIVRTAQSLVRHGLSAHALLPEHDASTHR